MKISGVITGAKVLRRKLATTEVTSCPTHIEVGIAGSMSKQQISRRNQLSIMYA